MEAGLTNPEASVRDDWYHELASRLFASRFVRFSAHSYAARSYVEMNRSRVTFSSQDEEGTGCYEELVNALQQKVVLLAAELTTEYRLLLSLCFYFHPCDFTL